jgi:hypothetical protein
LGPSGEVLQATASSEENGFLLELWVDRDKAGLGERVNAWVRITNVGNAAPTWETNTCGTGPAPVVVTAQGNVGRGREWDGVARAFKDQLLSSKGIEMDQPSTVGEFVQADMIGRNVSCTLMSQPKAFDPGQVVVGGQLAWDVLPREGSSIPEGEATLESTFSAEGIKVRTRASLTIEAGDTPALTLVDYADAALAEPSFRTWLEGHAPGAHMDPNVTYWPNNEGEFPRMEPYTGVRNPVVEIGVFYTEDPTDGFYGGVVLDRATNTVIGSRFE